jgi:hypothetical protein
VGGLAQGATVRSFAVVTETNQTTFSCSSDTDQSDNILGNAHPTLRNSLPCEAVHCHCTTEATQMRILSHVTVLQFTFKARSNSQTFNYNHRNTLAPTGAWTACTAHFNSTGIRGGRVVTQTLKLPTRAEHRTAVVQFPARDIYVCLLHGFRAGSAVWRAVCTVGTTAKTTRA